MKIAVWHDLPSGGGKRALYDHVRGLLERGHTIESWCTPTADQTFLPLRSIVTEHIVPLAVVEKGSWQASLGRLSSGATQTLAAVKAMDDHCRNCATEIDRGEFDVVLAGSSGPLAVSTLATHLKTPAVLYLGEPFRPFYEAPTPWPAPPKRLPADLRSLRLRLLEPARLHALRVQAREELRGVWAYSRVLANSQFSRESMIRAYGIEPHVCYLGVDTECFRDVGLPRKRLVMGIGTFFPHKRVDVVIKAVSRLDEPRPALAWVGNAASERYLDGLVSLAAQLGVDFTPYLAVSQDQVTQLLNEAAVLAYAPRLEPFGYAPLEAAACGLPVVARAEGGVRETVVDGVTGFLVNDDSELPSAIERLLVQPDLARKMGAAGRARAESEWSLKNATDRIEAHLWTVADGRRAVPTAVPREDVATPLDDVQW